jgi:hypothetical protein
VRAQQPARGKLTFQGDTAVWAVGVEPDKTADFEKVIGLLMIALMHSAMPERREQARGWRIVKQKKPLPDGTVVYVHLIDPIVPRADYTVMHILDDEYPDERQALYELYRGASARDLSLVVGHIVIDMSRGVTPGR